MRSVAVFLRLIMLQFNYAFSFYASTWSTSRQCNYGVHTMRAESPARGRLGQLNAIYAKLS